MYLWMQVSQKWAESRHIFSQALIWIRQPTVQVGDTIKQCIISITSTDVGQLIIIMLRRTCNILDFSCTDHKHN